MKSRMETSRETQQETHINYSKNIFLGLNIFVLIKTYFCQKHCHLLIQIRFNPLMHNVPK